MRNFIQELKSGKSHGTAVAPTCVLAHQRPCCKGAGYVLTVRGPFTRAELCKCIAECTKCLGHLHVIEGDAKAHACRTPSPRRVVNLMNDAAIPARYKDAGLNKFQNITGNGLHVKNEVTEWVQKFVRHPDGQKGLLLFGDVGIGKTYLLCSIAKNLVSHGIAVKFTDFFQLITQIRACYSEKRSDQSLIQPLLNADVLIIDELGKGRTSTFELLVLDQLIMDRYNQGKTVVASTNCLYRESKIVRRKREIDVHAQGSAAEINDYGYLDHRVGERTYSRLLEMTKVLEITGDDYRMRGH